MSLAGTLYHTGISRGSVKDPREVAAALHDFKLSYEATSRCTSHRLRLLAPQALGQLLLATGIQLRREGRLDEAMASFMESKKYFLCVQQECAQLQIRTERVLMSAETLGYLAVLDSVLLSDGRSASPCRDDCLKVLRGIATAQLKRPIFQTILSDKFHETDPMDLFADFAKDSESAFPAFVGYFDAITTGQRRTLSQSNAVSRQNSTERDDLDEELDMEEDFIFSPLLTSSPDADLRSQFSFMRCSEASDGHDGHPGRPASEVITRNIVAHSETDRDDFIQQLNKSYPEGSRRLPATIKEESKRHFLKYPLRPEFVSGQLESESCCSDPQVVKPSRQGHKGEDGVF